MCGSSLVGDQGHLHRHKIFVRVLFELPSAGRDNLGKASARLLLRNDGRLGVTLAAAEHALGEKVAEPERWTNLDSLHYNYFI